VRVQWGDGGGGCGARSSLGWMRFWAGFLYLCKGGSEFGVVAAF
jgi:hypothetical protein